VGSGGGGQSYAHRPVGLNQAPCGYEAVTAVASRAAQHEYQAGASTFHDALRHREPGVLHQTDFADACDHRQLVGV